MPNDAEAAKRRHLARIGFCVFCFAFFLQVVPTDWQRSQFIAALLAYTVARYDNHNQKQAGIFLLDGTRNHESGRRKEVLYGFVWVERQ
jgi:hypothetical protein